MATATLDINNASNDYTVGQFANDFTKLATSRGGAKDLLEAVINACEWMSHLGINKQIADSTASTIDPAKKGFSIMGLLHHLNGLFDQARVTNKDPSKLKKDIFTHATLGLANAAETVMFLDVTGIYVFKEGMKSIKTTFWLALGAFDVVNMYHGVQDIKEYQAQLGKAENEANREILNSKISLTYLQMLQSVTLVAMSAICLVSLVFSSMAQGLLFANPAVMLGFSSAWLVLNFVNYFYDKIITHRENNLQSLAKLNPKKEA